MNCNEPEVIANADSTLSNATLYGSVLTYTCHSGYEKTSEDSNLLCNMTDEYGNVGWIGSYPLCSGNIVIH